MKFSNGLLFSSFLLSACGGLPSNNTLASLNEEVIVVEDDPIEDSLTKALESYRSFLQNSSNQAITPEAIRRLADLQLENSSGLFDEDEEVQPLPYNSPAEDSVAGELFGEEGLAERKRNTPTVTEQKNPNRLSDIANIEGESEEAFEQRTLAEKEIEAESDNVLTVLPDGQQNPDLQRKEAISLYQKLLKEYPDFERNDQVFYQLSRAYQDEGEIEKSMVALDSLIAKFPNSEHIEEAYFRRAERHFLRNNFRAAQPLYKNIVSIGPASTFYEQSLYKYGWTLFKQNLYENALNAFVQLIDYKISSGYDLENPSSKTEAQQVGDVFRVISLSFSYIGGTEAITEYFQRLGSRQYEVDVYSYLGEHFLTKRRYSDAAQTYSSFVTRNPLHRRAARFHIRIIEIYERGNFTSLVLAEKQKFASTYDPQGEYWSFFDINTEPEVLEFVKQNMIELAGHFHHLYQNPTKGSKKKRLKAADLQKLRAQYFAQAENWYRRFLLSFADSAEESPHMNLQLGNLLFEQKDYEKAVTEYERSAYEYGLHDEASDAGLAAIDSYELWIKQAPAADRERIKLASIKSATRFASVFRKHPRAAPILAATAARLYTELRDYTAAVKVGRKLVVEYPKADPKLRVAAWKIVAFGSFDIGRFADAEQGYEALAKLLPKNSKERADIVDNLAASIYRQGELAQESGNLEEAAKHYLRVADAAPDSHIRANAEFDAATTYMQLKNWQQSAKILTRFRKRYTKHKLQPEVTKKLAYIYEQDSKFRNAAEEYEKIERLSGEDPELRRQALYQAGTLYDRAGDNARALKIYERYVERYPNPLELATETRYQIAEIYRKKKQQKRYHAMLATLIEAETKGTNSRSDRTRYLASQSGLILGVPKLRKYRKIQLKEPLQENLKKKQAAMKAVIEHHEKLFPYGVGEVTTAATYHIASTYYHFSQSLLNSPPPNGLNEDEKEQYLFLLEEQAYPFEEKSILFHEENIKFLTQEIYNEWVIKSIEELAKLIPVRYARSEKLTPYVEAIE